MLWTRARRDTTRAGRRGRKPPRGRRLPGDGPQRQRTPCWTVGDAGVVEGPAAGSVAGSVVGQPLQRGRLEGRRRRRERVGLGTPGCRIVGLAVLAAGRWFSRLLLWESSRNSRFCAKALRWGYSRSCRTRRKRVVEVVTTAGVARRDSGSNPTLQEANSASGLGRSSWAVTYSTSRCHHDSGSGQIVSSAN